MLTYATTFSGIGGWEIGLDACGWELKWQCERDTFCQSVLRERFGVPIYDDITTLLDHNPEPVDVLIGSPPCQPFSVAGEMRGTADERHLYPSFIRAVSALKPRWVLMEQVPAILSNDGGRSWGGYIGGLAALGYDLVWHCIPASAVGLPHQRDRVWLIAYSQCKRRTGAVRGNLTHLYHAVWPHSKPPDALGSRLSVFNAFEERVGEPAVLGVDDGLPYRSLRLKAVGNAVPPQIPYIIGQAINEIEGIIPEPGLTEP